MKDFAIKQLNIEGLFDEYNVELPLDREVNIFIGENGMGKTTILNILNCILSGNYGKLTSIAFNSIQVIFKDGESLSFSSDDLKSYNSTFLRGRNSMIDYDMLFDSKELQSLRNSFVHNNNLDNELIMRSCYKLSDMTGMPLHFAKREIIRYLMNYSKKKGNRDNVTKLKTTVAEKIGESVLYFPTYRRIEEDITKLGIEIEDDLKNHLINFGMTDVDEDISNVLKKISTNSIETLTDMTGILLSQLLNNTSDHHTETQLKITELKITLDRIGDRISKSDKNKIISLVSNGEIYDKNYSSLLNLLENLIESYRKQRENDEKVRQFVDVCNSYLIGKKYRYDESNVSLAVYKNNESIIDTQGLSSGEKQIISVFSKLYLEDNKKYIILFDEPELSLSIKWQAKFLPDIMDTKKCSMLIAVTHSPFIFDNKFDVYAKDMGQFVKRKK